MIRHNRRNRSQSFPMIVLIGFIGVLLLLEPTALADNITVLKRDIIIGHFSKSQPSSRSQPGNSVPDGWEPLIFKSIKKKTIYSLVKDLGQTVIKAESRCSSSGLIRYVNIDPNDYPIIQWRWKVSNTFEKGDVTQKEGDDYPARIYIAFAFDPKRAGPLEKTKYKTLKLFFGKTPPAGAINYIWASKSPHGTIVPSPYTEQSMMIVVQSGNAQVNQWVVETQNIVADYLAAFGEKPPMISAIAIMTDSNDTEETATGYYGDIVFKAKK